MHDPQILTALIGAFALMGTLFVFTVTAIVRREIAKLNGTYLRTELAMAEFRRINDHFDWLQHGGVHRAKAAAE